MKRIRSHKKKSSKSHRLKKKRPRCQKNRSEKKMETISVNPTSLFTVTKVPRRSYTAYCRQSIEAKNTHMLKIYIITAAFIACGALMVIGILKVCKLLKEAW